MAYVDKQAEFADSQVVTTTAVSQNIYDTFTNGVLQPNVTRDVGTGEDVYFVVQTDTAVTAAGAATVTVTLESSSTADLATNPTVHISSAAFPIAQLGAGRTLMQFKMPSGSYQRYIGVRFTVATGPLTTGAFSAFVSSGVQTFRAYAKAYTF